MFALKDVNGNDVAILSYSSNDFSEAMLDAGISCVIRRTGTGLWQTIIKRGRNERPVAKIKVGLGAVITIRIECRGKKYFFKKWNNWKLRFSVLTKEGEELLSLLPVVNWQKEAHDFTLQLNEEFDKECDSFLILHAVHCANLCMSMMTGGKVPALISI